MNIKDFTTEIYPLYFPNPLLLHLLPYYYFFKNISNPLSLAYSSPSSRPIIWYSRIMKTIDEQANYIHTCFLSKCFKHQDINVNKPNSSITVWNVTRLEVSFKCYIYRNETETLIVVVFGNHCCFFHSIIMQQIILCC